MSRTIKSVIAAFAFVLCIGVTASAAESYTSSFANDVSRYFDSSDPLPGAIPAMPEEQVKEEGEKYLTLGELDLSTIRNVLRRTAPMPSGLPSNEDGIPANAVPAEPISYVQPPVVYAQPAQVVYAQPAPVVYYEASKPAAQLVSSSTNADCLPCRKARR